MKSLKSHWFAAGGILVGLCSHAWAADLPFGQTQTGTIVAAAQSNSYTFSANANDVVDFTMVTGSGSLSPKLRLYNSVGTLISSAYSANAYGGCSGGSTVELNEVKLAASGVYTVLIGDCGDTNTGTYLIYTQRTNNLAGAAVLSFGGQPQTGAISAATQSNSYTFSANANDVVDFTLHASSGTLSPKIRLYNSAGTLIGSAYSANAYGGCSGSSTVELNEVKLAASGTYNVLFGDCGDTSAGSYVIYAQRTNNPAGATTVYFGGQPQPGTISSATQSVSYIFAGNVNDTVNFTLVTTSGSLSPKIRVYSPGGTLLSSAYSANAYGGCSGGSTVELNSVKLPASGTYTLLVGDCGDTNTGKYNISTQCFGTCTLPGTPCTFQLSAQSASLTAVGTSTDGVYPSVPQSFTVTPSAGCNGLPWTAATADIGGPGASTPSSFVSITSGASGAGTSTTTVSFNALANTHLSTRVASITITAAGATPGVFNITEAGSTQSLLNREVQALYQRSLGREPDSGGFNFWTCTTPAPGVACANLGLAGLGQMVDLFLSSAEGQNSDWQVLAIYQAILGRYPTYSEWVNAIAGLRSNPQNTVPAATALVSTLLNLPEYASSFSPVTNANLVKNLYLSALSRGPNATESANGTAALTASGTGAMYSLFNTIFTSAEFQNSGTFHTATDHTNGLFVRMMYLVILAREAETDGFNFWLGVAFSGGPGIYYNAPSTRVLIEGPGTPNVGFVGSTEFQGLFAN